MSAGNYLYLPPSDALRWFKVLAVFRFATSQGEQPGFELPPDRMPLRLGTPDGSPLLLIIDDQELLREAVSEFLAMQGYAIHAAGSGTEAMKLVEDGLRPDLLVCDVMLPDIRGAGFVREARILLPDVKVLFMSGFSPEAAELEIGNSSFLQKPFRLDVLARKVRSVLARGDLQ